MKYKIAVNSVSESPLLVLALVETASNFSFEFKVESFIIFFILIYLLI